MFGLVYTGNSKFCQSCVDTLYKTNLKTAWTDSFIDDKVFK